MLLKLRRQNRVSPLRIKLPVIIKEYNLSRVNKIIPKVLSKYPPIQILTPAGSKIPPRLMYKRVLYRNILILKAKTPSQVRK